MLRYLCSISLLVAAPLFANSPGGGPETGAPDVTLTDNGTTVTLSNGSLTAVVTKGNAKINSIIFNGVQLVGGDVYYSMDGGSGYRQPSGCTYTVTVNTPDMVDIGMRQTWSTQSQPLDIEVHYVLRRGDTGIYTYSLLDHPNTYPAGGYGEWRMVWKTPSDTFERLYVDDLRNREMPSSYDYANATSTSIAEILHINTGVLAGQDEGKYCYSSEYYKNPVWGHASNNNNTGVWLVLGAQEYLNDGPFKQDLAPAAGILHVHFGRNHYNGSSLALDAGESWRKLYGPYLLYCNTKAAGADACWQDAQAQAAAESAAWPYDWLTGNPDYPAAAQRATVSGTIDLNDPIKPTLDATGAWVGLAAPDPGGNFQFESKRYQHWVKADIGGSFTIPHVRPGNYTLYCVAEGEVGEFEYSSPVTVTAGQALSLGTLAWNIPRSGTWMAWEIGLPDRDSTEFRHGDDYFTPFIYNQFDNEFPNPLVYDVSSSIAATDWNFAQPGYNDGVNPITAWPWQVHFTLPSVPASGTARLHLSFAGGNYTRMYVDVNGSNPIGGSGFFYVNNDRGNGLLRQASHGKYGYHAIEIPVSSLNVGANTITITQGKVDDMSMHCMYDYVGLEMPTLPGGNPTDGDGDGLTDTWEIQHFITLSSTANEDPDGDTFTNAQEESGGSDPNNAASLPHADNDGDLIDDFWELTYYPTIESAAPLDDTDNDGVNTWTEWKAGTNPTSDTSYPGNLVADTATITAAADTSLFHRDGTYGYNSTNYGTAETLDGGQYGGGIWSLSYIRFDLSPLPAGATVTSAAFQVFQTSPNNIAGFPVSRSDTWTTGRFGTSGLLDQAGNTSQTWDETTLTGDTIGAELAQGVNPQFDTAIPRTVDFNGESETVSAGLIEVSGGTLAGFLQGRLDAATDTGLATIIVDYMEDSASSARGFTFVSKDTTSALQVPTLVIDYTAGIPLPDPDEDNDGLDDAWEAQKLGTLDKSADDDTDGDGTPEWLEASLGLNPKSMNEAFRAEVSESIPGSHVLSWPNAVGITFKVQSSTTLGPPWNLETTIAGSALPATLTHPIVTGPNRRFYRVGASQP